MFHNPFRHHAVLGHDAQEVGTCGITRQVDNCRIVVHLHHIQHAARRIIQSHAPNTGSRVPNLHRLTCRVRIQRDVVHVVVSDADMEGQVQRDDAVAAVDVLQGLYIVARLAIPFVIPFVAAVRYGYRDFGGISIPVVYGDTCCVVAARGIEAHDLINTRCIHQHHCRGVAVAPDVRHAALCHKDGGVGSAYLCLARYRDDWRLVHQHHHARRAATAVHRRACDAIHAEGIHIERCCLGTGAPYIAGGSARCQYRGVARTDCGVARDDNLWQWVHRHHNAGRGGTALCVGGRDHIGA